MGGCSSVVAVVAVVDTGPDVHTKTSLGLLLDLGDRSLGSIPDVSRDGGGWRLSSVSPGLGLEGSHGL